LTDFSQNDDAAFGLVIQRDRKIVTAGQANIGGALAFALSRYNPDGSLDFTFGQNGKVVTAFSGSDA